MTLARIRYIARLMELFSEAIQPRHAGSPPDGKDS